LALAVSGIGVDLVIAAHPIELGIPPSTVRTKVRGSWAAHPRDIANALGIRYEVLPHRGRGIEDALRLIAPSLGVIGGARILQPSVIELFEVGIINLHPGLIPEVRGLDALLWAIRGDHDLGVTAHLIDGRVDAGRVLARSRIEVQFDDTLFDLSERLYTQQLTLLPEAIHRARSGAWELLSADLPPHHPKMTPAEERETAFSVGEYVQRHSSPPEASS
jgi:phosphoribosylglycinamide formyltransferase-1